MRSIKIGVLGLGNVGAGVLRILREHAQTLEQRVSARIEVKRVLVRDLSSPREVETPEGLLTTDASVVLDDPEIAVIVELIGGTTAAKDMVEQALSAGKHVVTANKALLAEHGEVLFQRAQEVGCELLFEGAVAGGIPVLRAIRHGLASDRVHRICGIVNGTSNYVLDKMTRDGLGYAEAVSQAQAAGYAEADPSLDVGGVDAAHKLALLALLSFGKRVALDSIFVEGIESVRDYDLAVAKDLGYVVRSLAIASRLEEDALRLRVHPVLLPQDHVLAGVHGAYNAVLVESEALGRSMYYGQGAGMMPTGVAVTSDIMDVARTILAHRAGEASIKGDDASPVRPLASVVGASMDSVEHANYVCVHVAHVSGVLGRVATILGAHGVSIAKMRQDHPEGASHARLVIVTEVVSEAAMAAAISEIERGDDCVEPTVRIRFMESRD
jgi:homoserine dehydrogenase